MLQRNIHVDAVPLAAKVNRLVVKGGLVPVHIAHEIRDATLEAVFLFALVPLVNERESHAPAEVGQLPHAFGDGLELHVQRFEHALIRQKGDLAAPLSGAALLLKGGHGLTGMDLTLAILIAAEGLGICLAAGINLDL